MKHKAQPEAAANGVEVWVKNEREMRERLQREKDAREVREQALVSSYYIYIYIYICLILKNPLLPPQLSARNVKRKLKKRL